MSPQPPPHRTVYDLRAFQRALPNRHGKLAKAIRRWTDYHSAQSDISIALGYTDSALRIPDSEDQTLIYARVALQQAAIVLYARALERKSIHRGAVRIQGQFPPANAEMHRKLLKIRDDGIAHFGPEGNERAWAEDLALLVETGIVWRPIIAARRSLFDKRFAGEMRDHFKFAMEVVREGADTWRNTLIRRLNEDTLSTEVYTLLKGCVVPESVLGDAAHFVLQDNPPDRGVGIFRDAED